MPTVTEPFPLLADTRLLLRVPSPAKTTPASQARSVPGNFFLTMRPAPLTLLALALAGALLLACFQPVLFQGRQFAYRDSAHFYYPLYLRVQQEWHAGRWPLWDPWQNAGMPLLAMPMAAVLYPGKLLHAVLPYPWATRLYVVAHVALAWAGMFVLARAWGRSATAAGLAAMAYAFGAPVLFQYCNVIFLVGAAWVPWGFAALDRLLRRRRSGLPALAVVLAMQVLGGDPEAAYLTVLCGAGYAIVLAARGGRGRPGRGGRWRSWAVVASAMVVAWAGITLGVAYFWTRSAAPRGLPPLGIVRLAAWGLAGLWVALGWKQRPRSPRARLGPRLASLGGGCVLAMLLTAAQLVPGLEYTRATLRAADDRPGRIYGFCVEPYRMAEAVWPNAYGTFGPENRSWVQAFPPSGDRRHWVPSLYLGGLTLVLALGGFGFRGRPPWRTWLSIVAVVAILASFGRFGGPLWATRWLPGVQTVLGPHDPTKGVDRLDPSLHDGAGSVYGLLADVMPGFFLFRYPGKLYTFAAIAVAGLAAWGWDRAASGPAEAARASRRAAAAGLSASVLALAALLVARGPLLAWLGRHLPPDVEFGPIDVRGALADSLGGLAHGGVVFALGLVLIVLAPRRPRAAGALALILSTADLGLANARLVWTAPQAAFEGTPRVAMLIDDAERASPSPGPFRVNRMSIPHPDDFVHRASPRRVDEALAWERGTLHPLFGLPLDVHYTMVQGILEIDDYVQFFNSRLVLQPAASGAPVYSLPRRGFDLWNSRYFVMPITANGWLGESQNFERLYPLDEVARDPERAKAWLARENWQLLRNKAAFPRAWLVHYVKVRKPVSIRDTSEGVELMKDLVYQADSYWNDPNRGTYDLRALAFVETDQPRAFAGYVARASVTPHESVAVTRHEPQRVELVATLERPGLVVLADTFYPGWHLTIDGQPATIYRTNRMMRGALVKAGRHTLVYTYDPASFRIGGALSIVGLVILAALLPWAAFRRGRVASRRAPDR